MSFSIIAAMSQNRVIGLDNSLPWRLPADLRFFKGKTMGHTLIMGRKTYESLQKFLAGRRIIVLTRDRNFSTDQAETALSLKEAIGLVEENQETFIAGGAEIYGQALEEEIVDTMYLTLVHENFEGDTYFPEFSESEWVLAERKYNKKDEKNPHDFSFLKYVRR
jgi:dihydrofolate reductase